MKDNKLIAEFIGLHDDILSTGNVHSWSDAPFFYITEDSKEKVMEGITKYSKYHTSWDWLMPVIEKIENDGLDPHEMIDGSLRKNKQKRWRSIEDLYNVAVYLINIYNNGSTRTS